MAEVVPIASLRPHEAVPADRAIDAEVSLLWPYSTSHASCALLLVDPDFRRRHARGEIRVRFQGPVAKQLALAKVGIGNRIKLDLAGARWRESDKKALQLTPGRPVEAELLFDRHVRFAVLDSSATKEVHVVEYDEPSAPVSDAGDDPRVPSTPGAALVRTGATNSPIVGGYASPAYMKRLRLSQGQYLDSPGLTRVSNDLENSAGKRRKLSGESTIKWTVVRTEPSADLDAATTAGGPTMSSAPVDDSDPFVDTSALHHKEQSKVSAASQSTADRQDDSMKPPPRSRLEKPVLMPAIDLKDSGPLTPKLIPVSPGSLPQPSPFPQTPLSTAGIFQPSSRGVPFPTLGEADVASLPPKSLGYFDFGSSKVTTEPKGVTQEPTGVAHDPIDGKSAGSLHEQASSTDPVVIEIDDDAEESDVAEEEDEVGSQTSELSGRSAPSDDDEDGDVVTQKQRFFAGDSGPPTSQLASYIGSPVLPSEVENVPPSALPVLNDHHPYGLEDPLLVRKASRDDSQKSPSDREKIEAEVVLSDDEDAAWQAMDEAMHGMAPDAHEKHQAPAMPLTSVMEPAQRRPSTQAATRPSKLSAETPTLSRDPIATAPIEPKPTLAVSDVPPEATVHAKPDTPPPDNNEKRDAAPDQSNGHQHPKPAPDDDATATAAKTIALDQISTTEAPRAKPRKRPATRLSLISNGLDEYFGPQKSPVEPAARDRRRTIHDLPPEPQPTPVTDTPGTTTSLTYLTPLSALSPHLNTPTPLDVLAVVVSATDPLRAKSGPRDWHTSLALATPSSTDGLTRAEIFRPWKASLPTAQKGDVILLRNFLARSRERRPGLLSSEASAWCVFRDEHEETRGPPVEVGEEERSLAKELKEWWTRQDQKAKGKGRATL